MTLKDWKLVSKMDDFHNTHYKKKLLNLYIRKVGKSSYDIIVKGDIGWTSEYYKENIVNRKSYPQALKFAKSYMRKH